MENKVNVLKSECMNELTQNIIPFWNRLIDTEYGGFYGSVDNNLIIDKKADKGVILNSRILWFYSQAFITVGGENNLKNAGHAYEFLKNYCVDYKNGGVYWMMTYDGNVSDNMKHTYNQAFAIYALSTYYLASHDENALRLAVSIFETVEEKCSDNIAYADAFSADWRPVSNEALSENGLIADKTMNTILHLIEAYTVLYTAYSKNEKVGEKLKFLLDITEEKVLDKCNNKLFVFFDKEMNVIGDIHSYGHDIEATWLIDRACSVLDDESYISKWKDINLKISENIYNTAFENNSLNNERENDKIDRKRVWWVQAESVVGLVNAYINSKKEKYLQAALQIWEFIKKYQVDRRDNSEWWGEADYNGNPMNTVNMVGPWKCPYHNGRMCIEIINRDII